jgi:hypothetical protein
MDIFSCFGMWNSCQKFVLTFQLHLYSCQDGSNDAVQYGGAKWLRRWVGKSHSGSTIVGVECVVCCYPMGRDDVVNKNG